VGILGWDKAVRPGQEVKVVNDPGHLPMDCTQLTEHKLVIRVWMKLLNLSG